VIMGCRRYSRCRMGNRVVTQALEGENSGLGRALITHWTLTDPYVGDSTTLAATVTRRGPRIINISRAIPVRTSARLPIRGSAKLGARPALG
jgi:hypothetical protein